MDESETVTLIKRRFTIRVLATAEIGQWWEPFVERWREALIAAGGQPFGDPAVHFGPISSATMQREVVVVGTALISEALTDALDAAMED